MQELFNNPLVFPPVAPCSRLEQFCMSVPLLGWLIAATMWERRLAPACSHINEQLLLRTESTWSCWGDDPARLHVAHVVCEELQKEFGWVNPNFIPEDPMRVLWTRCDIEVEFIFALFEAEIRLGINDAARQSLNGRMKPWLQPTAKLGDLVDDILLQMKCVDKS